MITDALVINCTLCSYQAIYEFQ
ncbi:unnamed protein product [Allacma fusca]|uniref:Uncharacterized protein n=1 Tax=Allacma fusca TaxID=39272 RepID=A0A8J2PV50_9HEXA|nr:unnamed protein product [Allacma fusca]